MAYKPPVIRTAKQDDGPYLNRDDAVAVIQGYSDFLEEQYRMTGRNNHKPHQALAAMAAHLRVQGNGGDPFPPAYSIPVSQELAQAIESYRGQWVAIEHGEIVAVGNTLGEIKYEGNSPVFWKVPFTGAIRF